MSEEIQNQFDPVATIFKQLLQPEMKLSPLEKLAKRIDELEKRVKFLEKYRDGNY